MDETKSGGRLAGVGEAVLRPRARISVVWLIPLVSVLIGAWLTYQAFSDRGPTITITFESAEGLEAGKTKIKYRDLEMGVVESLELAEDLSHVTVSAQLAKGTDRWLTRATRFWVVRARVTAGGVSGLGTFLSGAYIGIDPIADGKPTRHFTGLEVPPLVTSKEQGRRFVLHAPDGGSLQIGSPVYYRQVEVGQVLRSTLDPTTDFVTVDLFVRAPYDAKVHPQTRFWNVSGIGVTVDASGVQIDTESLVSVLIGGVAFETTGPTDGAPAAAGTVFPLYENHRATATRMYDIKQRFLLYFTGSVKGLLPGAPVEFRGMPIGRVVDLRLEYDETAEDFRIPVVIEVEPERIAGHGTERVDFETIVERLVGRGLRARLKSGNLLTGQLIVDLDLVPGLPPTPITRGGAYSELPTVPTTLEAISATLTRLVDRLNALPLEDLGRELQGSLAALRGTLEQTRGLTTDLNADLMPAVAATLTEAQATFASARALVGADSVVTTELKRVLIELGEAAKAIRLLADHLEQNPEDLLRGKRGE